MMSSCPYDVSNAEVGFLAYEFSLLMSAHILDIGPKFVKDHHPYVTSSSPPGFHEAIGDLIALSVNTPKHLQEVLGLEPAKAPLSQAEQREKVMLIFTCIPSIFIKKFFTLYKS